MKRCDYCGRESEDTAEHCRECGQVLKEVLKVKEAPLQRRDITADAYVSNMLSAGLFKGEEPLDLSGFDMRYSFDEGFSHADWRLISQQIRTGFAKELWPQAWREVGIRWLGQLCEDLGGDYRQYESHNFLLLSAQTTECSEAILQIAEESIAMICEIVGPINFGKPVYGKHIVLVFNEEDDYYSYISHFHRDGDHSQSAGIFISSGYYHVALPYFDTVEARRVLAHELTHNYVCYLDLPIWLNEGLSRRVEHELVRRLYGGWGSGKVLRAPVLDADLAEEHHTYWNEQNIQEFWAGTSFYGPGEVNKLSYSLGEILVELIAANWGDFLDFVKNADWRDAGQDAALKCLSRDLGEIAGTFLGPGVWRPRRKTILDLWEQMKKKDGK